MTIKPATKRAPPDTDGKIENPNGAGTDSTGSNLHGQQNVVVGRSGVATGHRNSVGLDAHSQSPQRRELYEDLSRHRCSPNKSGRNKRRDHLHDQHHKRERNERVESHMHAGAGNTASNNPRTHGVNLSVGGMLLPNGGNLSLSTTGNVTSGVAGRNSPAVGDMTTNSNILTTAGNSPASLSNVGGGSVSPARSDYHGPSSSTGGSKVLQAASTIESIEESCSGYNSGDEHMAPKEKTVTAAEWTRRDEQFLRAMLELGFEIYGDEDAHDIVRQHTMDYIFKNREYFSHFVTEDIDSYITRKRRKDSHGNHIEIQAMSEIYSRPVEVYCYKSKPINIFNSEQHRNGYAPLRLSYQRSSHYNAIIDPYNATVGVGLGIANYHPTMQTKEAMRLSEQLEIEQTMFEDKLKTTDWEATNEVIEEQVARESYLQWCRENMQKNRAAVARSATATITSAQASKTDECSSLDEIASPSKYANICNSSNNNNINNNSNINSSNNGFMNFSKSGDSSSTTTSPQSASSLVTSRKLNYTSDKQCNNENGTGAGAGVNMTSGKLSNLAKFQKEAAIAATAVSYDSDDTDISTSSSLTDSALGDYASGNNSPQNATVVRTKKLKTRFNSKKRRHEKLIRLTENVENKAQLAHRSSMDNLSNSVANIDASKRSNKTAKLESISTEQKVYGSITGISGNGGDLFEERPCSSKCAQLLLDTSGISNANSLGATASAPLSSFYQDLLESSYTADGFGQLTETEMLQRAIQMSTHDFIEDQKRKYIYRP